MIVTWQIDARQTVVAPHHLLQYKYFSKTADSENPCFDRWMIITTRITNNFAQSAPSGGRQTILE